MTVVALLLFEGCDVMDVTGPYEVLLTANRLASRWVVDLPFEVRTVSLDGRSVVALFPMVRMNDGTWRIDGVVLVPATGKRAENDKEPGVLG